MNIGILTFHRAVNYGAVMQAYALSTRLKKLFPDDQVEIIDYNSLIREHFKKKCPIVFCYRRSIKEGVYKIIQTRVFNSFVKRLRLSKEQFIGNEDELANYISDRYDIVIVGSDAVFNWNDIGLPNIYFLDSVDVKYKMSYAASAHLQKYNDVSDKSKDYLLHALGSFTYLGVRDDNTSRFVKGVLGSGEMIAHNCDPSIFLDMSFSEDNLSNKLRRKRFNFNKKTVFIMLMKSQYGEFVRKYFGDSVQIVSLMDGNKYADIYLYDLNPFEWAHVFKYGSFLITDYFHGTIFGLKNGIPVMSIDSSSYDNDDMGYQSKAKDLLFNRLHIPYVYMNATNLNSVDGYRNFCNKIEEITREFDPDIVEQKLKEEASSFNGFVTYLKNVVVRGQI